MIKVVYINILDNLPPLKNCHPAYLTYRQSTSCEMQVYYHPAYLTYMQST